MGEIPGETLGGGDGVTDAVARASARRAGYPLLRFLSAFPIACFSGALATDIAYAATANILWADFSDWLLAGGMAMGVLAALVGLGNLFVDRDLRRARHAGILAAGSILALVFGFLNNLVHSRDAWTSVVPWGLTLSAITVAVVVATVWLGLGQFQAPGLRGAYVPARARVPL